MAAEWMERVEFNKKNFGLLPTVGIAWVNINCPICHQYRSDSFIPELERGKKEYITRCNRCNEQVITDMGSIESNDKLIDEIENNVRTFEGDIKRNGNACLGDFK